MTILTQDILKHLKALPNRALSRAEVRILVDELEAAERRIEVLRSGYETILGDVGKLAAWDIAKVMLADDDRLADQGSHTAQEDS